MRLPLGLVFLACHYYYYGTNAQPQPLLQACYDVPTTSPGGDLPLCGNGVLDAGELCDDGNRFDGDGCSAFCSHFDALSHAATLAGSTAACPSGVTPVLGGPTSTNLFCNLRAVDTAPDGAYVLLGDGGKLLRYSLFTDAAAGQIVQLQASITTAFQAICSIGVLAADGAIVVHDCGTGRFHIATREGTHGQLLVDLAAGATPPLQPPRLNLKSYYDRVARYVVTAAVVTIANDNNGGGCLSVYGLSISAFENFYAQAVPSLLATIPCTLYGVWERGARLTSFDVRGMEPYLVTRERCPSTFRAGQWCFCVHMQRVAHMAFLRAYLPEDGGLDLQYYAATSNLYDNALGAPLIRSGGFNASNDLVYILRGACFQVESRLLTASGKAPQAATLGNTCRRAPLLGLRCSTPFNNPFITDVMTSPVLLPDGLSATHTHAELSAIYGAGCPRLANVTTAGPMLYQSTLANVYGNTTPVDFVELAGTLDVVYVTPTSVGLISTKRILFQDRAQPGYARATNLIYCPTGFFGYVGSVCRPCNNTKAPGYYVSVAWQIQCVTPAAVGGGQSAGVSPPFETFTVVANRNVTVETLRTAVCVFTESKGVACPAADDVSMLPPQQFNLAADTLESTLANPAPAAEAAAAAKPPQDLIHCLIENAEKQTGRTILRAIPDEYSARVISLSTGLLDATSVRIFDTTAANYTDNADIAPEIAAACLNAMATGFGSLMACAARQQQYITADGGGGGGGRRRRLLQANTEQQQQQLASTEHHAVALGSSTVISWSKTLPPGWDGSALAPSPPPAAAAAPPFQFPLWLGVAVGVACALLLAGLFYIVYRRRFRRAAAPAASTARTRADYGAAVYMRLPVRTAASYSSR